MDSTTATKAAITASTSKTTTLATDSTTATDNATITSAAGSESSSSGGSDSTVVVVAVASVLSTALVVSLFSFLLGRRRRQKVTQLSIPRGMVGLPGHTRPIMLDNPVFVGIEASAVSSSQDGYGDRDACDWRIAVGHGGVPAPQAHGASTIQKHGLGASASDPLVDQPSSSGGLTENPVYIAYSASGTEYSSPLTLSSGVSTAGHVSTSDSSPPGHWHEYDYVSPVRAIARSGDTKAQTMSPYEPSRDASACSLPGDEHVYDHVSPAPAMALDGDTETSTVSPARVLTSVYSPSGHEHVYDHVLPASAITLHGDTQTPATLSHQPSCVSMSAYRPLGHANEYDHVLPAPAMRLDGDTDTPRTSPYQSARVSASGYSSPSQEYELPVALGIAMNLPTTSDGRPHSSQSGPVSSSTTTGGGMKVPDVPPRLPARKSATSCAAHAVASPSVVTPGTYANTPAQTLRLTSSHENPAYLECTGGHSSTQLRDVTAPALPPRRQPAQTLTSDELTENPAYVASSR